MTDEEEIFLYDDYEDVSVSYSEKPAGGEKMKKKDKPAGKGGEDRIGHEQREEERAVDAGGTGSGAVKSAKKEVKREEAERKGAEQKRAVKEAKKEDAAEFEAKEEQKELKEEEFSERKEEKGGSNVWIYITVLLIVTVIASIFYIKVFFKAEKPAAAATVNGEAITLEELNKQYGRLPEQYRLFITKESILDRMIDEKILLQEAKKQGIAVTDSDVEKAIDDSIEQNSLTKEGFEELVKEQGLTIEDVRESYKKQLLVNGLLDKEVRGKIAIPQDDVRAYYDGLIRASHILAETEEGANKIYEELMAGGNFSGIAEKSSIDTSTAVRGGDLGEFGRGQMVAEFEDAAFSLKIGEVSKPVKTQFGWHIIKRTEKQLGYDEVKDKIEEMLASQKEEESYNAYITGIREKADIKKSSIAPEAASTEEGKETNGVVAEVAGEDSCTAVQGITKDTVIFYYADWCIDKDTCINAKKSVDKLKAKYSIYEAESVDGTLPAVLDCFDIDKAMVPQFICAGSKETKVGTLSERGLADFAEGCARQAKA